MPLDFLTKKKIREWLDAKCPRLLDPAHGCAACGGTDWEIHELSAVVTVPDVGESFTPFAETSLARCARLVCEACGYTVLISTKKIGLPPEDQPAQET